MIRRLLIANRGEIALRVLLACRELKIESVAVYSDADRRARHVVLADRAVRIGPAPASESYLSVSRIMDAARSVGADAIHPGYGFLSEDPALAKACEHAGITFVGPPSAVIARMGSKIEARRMLEAAGVPVVPGQTPGDQSDEGLRRAVERVGLPAIIKASAGGGGKGMRVVRDRDEIDDLVRSARREATAAFGHGTLYVERLLNRARHVEVQVLADGDGHVVHLFERECSVQRRHQKVIEESPSPALTPALRARLCDAATLAARAASYRNAGTIEFLLEGSGDTARFYFLEMNTRLQVEHPVTEQVTGVDLVRGQLLVASGGPLPWSQETLAQRGHAIEARVYAEDPARGFIPQAGPLLLYREPRMPGVRVDSGVAEEDEVSVHYDPMLAKVIATAESRDLAVTRLAAALRQFPILGIHTNISLLLRILDDRRFQAGEIDTGFLDGDGAILVESVASPVPAFVDAALTAEQARQSSSEVPDDRGDDHERMGWDPWQGPGDRAPEEADSRVARIANGTYRVETDEGGRLVYVAGSANDYWAFCEGLTFHGTPPPAPPPHSLQRGAPPPHSLSRGAPPPRGGGDLGVQSLTAPMPGTVVKVLVTPGTNVKKGDTVLVLEAMKMEWPVRAGADGTVRAIYCQEGELVQPDMTLVELG